MRLELEDLRHGYHDVLQAILKEGERTSPRGQETREVVGMELVVRKPWDMLPVGTGRGLNTKIAAVEALQLIGGAHYGDLMRKATPSGASAFDDTNRFGGSYGTRIRTQLDAVVQRIMDDPDTRGAVLQLWDPLYELGEDGCSYMCTIAIQFLVRNDRLQTHVMMRSNDAWLGLPYDAFMFSQLGITVANLTGHCVGSYHHRATSMHLYAKHLEVADSVTDEPGPLPDPFPFGVHGRTPRECQLNARAYLDGSAGEGWWFRALKPLFA